MYFFGSDGGPLDWASYNAHVANLERDKEQVTPDVTLTVQWDKYKDAFATQVAKGKATDASAAAAAADGSKGTFV